MTITNIGDILPAVKNARRRTERGAGMIARSIEENGFGRSVLLAADGSLIAGSGTIDASAEVGLENVQIVDSDGTRIIAVRRTDVQPGSERAHKLAIADNRTTDLSEFDPAILAELSTEVDLSAFWFDDELAALLADAEVPSEPGVDPGDQTDRADELAAKWGVQPNDLWFCGNHRLICGDCTDPNVIARLLDGAVPDMIFADPPYGISIVATNGYVGGGEAYDIPFGGVKKRKGLGTANGAKPFGSQKDRGGIGGVNVGNNRLSVIVDPSKTISVGKYMPVTNDDTTETAINAYRVMADLFPKAAQVWWGGNYYANKLPPSSCWLVWDKENTGNFADCELAWTNQPTAVRIFRHQWNGMLRDSERERRFHPTQKPAALAAWCFDKYTEPDALILDPFVGGGMSLVGAEQSGRRVHGVEVEAHYIACVLERWADMTGMEPRRAD